MPATASTSSEQAPLVDLAQLAPGPTAPCGNPLKRPERHEPAQDAGEHAAELPQRKVRRQLSETENTLQQLTQGTLAAVRANSWVNANRGEPDTVEFKLRMFLNHVRKVCAAIPRGGRQLTPVETDFPMFVCSCLFEAEWGDHLDLPLFWEHLCAWTTLCAQHCPGAASPLFQVIGHLVEEAEKSSPSSGLPANLLSDLNITQESYIYSSKLHQTFRKNLFDKQLLELRTKTDPPEGSARGS